MKYILRCLFWALVAWAVLHYTGYAQDVTVNCGAGKPVATVQADGSIKITCKTETPPVPPPPVEPPKPPVAPPTTNGKTWQATPANLQELIGSGSSVKPGDTIELQPGEYVPPSWGPYLAFRAQLSGIDGGRITLKGQPGAYLSCGKSLYGCLYLEGDYLTLSGVEITNTDPDRTKPRGNGIEVRGNFLTIEDCYIHAVSTGVFASEGAKWLKIVGNRVIDNGYKASDDQPHGNGLYVQNDGLSVKEIRGNIVGNSYGNGIQLFGRNAETRGYVVEDNIVFGSGSPSNWPNRNFIVGGSKKGSDGLIVRNNFFYHDLAFAGANVFFGYEKGNGSARISGNWIIGGTGAYIIDWSDLVFENNVIIAQGRGLTYDSPDWGGSWKGNQYYFPDGGFASQGGLPVKTWTWAQWKANTDEQGSAFYPFSTNLNPYSFTPSPGNLLPQWVKYPHGMAIYSPSEVFNLSPWIPAGKQAVDAVTGKPVAMCTGFCAVVFSK